jgi:hypothetical protein
MVSAREDTRVAKAFVAQTIAKQGNPEGLVVHADRGSAQTAKPLALLSALHHDVADKFRVLVGGVLVQVVIRRGWAHCLLPSYGDGKGFA